MLLGKTAQGDRRTVTITVTDAPDISGAIIDGVKRNRVTNVTSALDGTFAVTSASTFTWTRGEADTGTPGTFDVQFRITVSGVPYLTLPATWTVVRSPLLLPLAEESITLVGVTAGQAAWLAAAATLHPAPDALLSDAPNDGQQYVRQSGDWAVAAAGLPDVPDANLYGRRSTGWEQLGSAALEDTSAFDAVGSAAAVADDLSAHTELTTTAHGGILSTNAGIVSVTSMRNLTSTDAGKILECDGTFVLNAPTGLPTGFQCAVVNVGTGVITFTSAGTLQSKNNLVTLQNRYSVVAIYHRGGNVWCLFGDLS